jgi:exonuclease III
MASIIQWNIRGLRANYNEFQLHISSHQPVAFCLQKLLTADSYQFQNKHYSHVTKLPDLDSHNRPTSGTGILTQKDIPHSVIPLDLPIQAVACRISIPEPMNVCSVYLPPTSIWNYKDLLNLVSKLPTPVILMADFNSHSTLWGCSSTNHSGLEIENFLLHCNLCLFNDKYPTYLHPASGSQSSLDLAFCDTSLYMNYTWSVHEDLW